MADRPTEFRDALIALVDASPEPMDHPTAEQWIAYHRGALPAGEEARLQEHLARCRDCFDLAAAAAELARPPAAPTPGEEAETAALWRLLRPQLGPPPPGNVREIATGRRWPSRPFRLLPALAAAMFVALAGMTVWNLRLQGGLDRLRAPQPDVAVFAFFGGERLAAPAAAARSWTPAGRSLDAVFHPAAAELPAYWLSDPTSRDRRELWSYALRPDEDLAFTL